MSPLTVGLLSRIPPGLIGTLEVGEKGSLLQDPWHDSSYFAPDRKEDNKKSHLCTPHVFAKMMKIMAFIFNPSFAPSLHLIITFHFFHFISTFQYCFITITLKSVEKILYQSNEKKN